MMVLNRSQPATLGKPCPAGCVVVVRWEWWGGGWGWFNSSRARADITSFTREPGCQRTMGIAADTLHRFSEHRHIKALLQPKWINKWKKGGQTVDKMVTRLPGGDSKTDRRQQ